MNMRFRILGSSSKGNAALLTTNGARILVDVGFTVKKLESMLTGIGESLQSVDAIFLTHEHGDHSAGLRGLAKYPTITVFANEDTAEAAQRQTGYRLNWKIFETGSRFQFKDLEVSSFQIPHDAADPVGYTFTTGTGEPHSPKRSVVWCTDLGHAPRLIQEKIRDADVLVIESNYDSRMLDESPRPWSLKQRIKGRHGHLCNDATLELLSSIQQPRWQQIYLAHLSDECNKPSIVERCFAEFSKQRAFNLAVVDPINGLLPEYVF